jgi:hypothetical protein
MRSSGPLRHNATGAHPAPSPIRVVTAAPPQSHCASLVASASATHRDLCISSCHTPRAASAVRPLRPASSGGGAGLVSDGCSDPVEALVQPVPCGRTRHLDLPQAPPQPVQPELLCNLRRRHRLGQVLHAAGKRGGGGRRGGGAVGALVSLRLPRRRVTGACPRTPRPTCLLAKTSSAALVNSGSLSMRWSSSRASSTRSRSFESTTKIRPCVFW